MGESPRTPPQYPAAEIPEATGVVRPLRPYEDPRTLASSLIPTVDTIRQLYTQLGLRDYRVFLIFAAWSGPSRGQGTHTELARVELLPTPRIVDMSGVSEVLHGTGLTEEGGITINQISAKYSEDDLMGRTPPLQEPDDIRTGKKNISFFWEVVQGAGTGCGPGAAQGGKRRRFVPVAAPMRSKDTFSWSVNLIKQEVDRDRTGGSGRERGRL